MLNRRRVREKLAMLLAQGVRVPLLAEQISIHLLLVPQIVSNYPIDIGQRQRRKALGQGFRAVPLVEALDERIERYPGAAHADSAPIVHAQEYWVGTHG